MPFQIRRDNVSWMKLLKQDCKVLDFGISCKLSRDFRTFIYPMSSPLIPGNTAPDFEATAVGGGYSANSTIKLSDLKGETVVLYFYPKDDTPGCTRQACALRDGWTDITTKAKVFGVSIDSVKSHEKFIQKYSLPFPILSDEDQNIVNAYGVWVEKSMYGKKYMGTERTTFVIGPDGRIKAVFPKVKPEEHLEKVLGVL